MSIQEIIAAVAAGKITVEAGIAAAVASQQKTLTCKVSEKGALSLYGLQRMPVTLYSGQWERLLAHADAIKTFIVENRAKLSTGKDDKKTAAPTAAPTADPKEAALAALMALQGAQ